METATTATPQDDVKTGEIFDLKEIVPLQPIRQQLAALEEANAVLVFDYNDKQGNKDARSHVHKLRLAKGELERARKAAKEHALAYGRAVDAEAKELEARYEIMIDVHMRPIQEASEREEKRVAAIDAELKVLRDLIDAPNTGRKYSSAEVEQLIAEAEGFTCGDTLQEKLQEGQALRTHAIATLQRYLADVRKQEADAAELARLRQEQQQREQEERLRKLQQEQADAEAQRKAQQDEQRKALLQTKLKALGDLGKGLVNGKAVSSTVLRHEISKVVLGDEWGDNLMMAEIALQGATLFADRLADQEAQQAEANRKEQERLADEQRQADAVAQAERERQAREEGERIAREQQEAQALREQQEENERRANEEHRRAVIDAALAALADGGVNAKAAKLAVDLILQGKVPAITIQF
jgi:hypothetical protein